MNSNFLSEEKINEIRTSVDIVEIISSYLPLIAKGKNFFGVCPFHSDHSPSMSVSKEKQIYTCFSCGATGNVYNFIMDYENVSFIEAVKIVANKAGFILNINDDLKTDKNKITVAKIAQIFFFPCIFNPSFLLLLHTWKNAYTRRCMRKSVNFSYSNIRYRLWPMPVKV